MEFRLYVRVSGPEMAVTVLLLGFQSQLRSKCMESLSTLKVNVISFTADQFSKPWASAISSGTDLSVSVASWVSSFCFGSVLQDAKNKIANNPTM